MSLTRSNRPLSSCSRDRRRLERLVRQRRRQLFEQLLLLLRQLLRRVDLDRDEQVAVAAAADVGHALAAHAERRAALRACRNRERLVAVERRDLDLAAERERREVQRHLAVQVVAVALEERVLLHVDDDVEIAGRAAARAGFAFAAEAQALAGGDAGGDADGELLLLLHASRAAARRARLGDDRAGAAALAARARDGEEALLIAKLPAALALRARRRLACRAPRRCRCRSRTFPAAESGSPSRCPWRLRRTRSRGRSAGRRRAAGRRVAGPPPKTSPKPKMSPRPPRMSSKPVNALGSKPPVAAPPSPAWPKRSYMCRLSVSARTA